MHLEMEMEIPQLYSANLISQQMTIDKDVSCHCSRYNFASVHFVRQLFAKAAKAVIDINRDTLSER